MISKPAINFLILMLFCFTTQAQKSFLQTGEASWISDDLNGRYTASGEKYDTTAYTAAHMTLPFGTLTEVTNMQNGKSVVVKINDRGPFVPERIIDVSKAAAKELQMIHSGATQVKVEVVNKSMTQKPTIPEKTAEPKTISTNKPFPASKSVDKPVTETKKASSGFMRVDTADKMEGFAVQIGSYNRLKNALEAIEKISTRSDGPFHIHISEQEDGTELIRVLVGKYSTRVEADSLKKKLSEINPGCFVITIENIQ